ncbi:MAG TPA: hypothetical protein VFX98_06020 [Longimicrobiaceae bacterium]|nr:hypothetical protein [Longimicrobiaceae bacterium]
MLWVQRVDILYTKESRGAPAATARNRLPRALAMHAGADDGYAYEHYWLLERNDFTPTLKESRAGPAPPRRQGDLVIGAANDTVTLGLRYNRAIGLPVRHDTPRALTLAKGQTARLIINGRYSSYSGQLYTEATYNVAFGDSLPPDVFLSREPDATLDMRADLF